MSKPFPAPWGNYILRDLAETTAPEQISWLPQTLAWQVIYFVIVVWFCIKVFRRYQVYKANAYRRDALNWIAQLPHYDDKAPDPMYRQLPALIKRTALVHFTRSKVNQVPTQEWDKWLDLQCNQTQFEQKCPQLLSQLSYSAAVNIDAKMMTILTEQIKLWITHHGNKHD